MNRACASSVLVFVSVAGAAALGACGGAAESNAPAKAASPAEPAEEREPTTVAEAQERIDRARAQLEPARAKTDADKDSTADSAAPRAPKTSTTPPSGGTSVTTSPREEAAKSEANACGQSCRALSSMRRAVTALCRMTGDDDARCSDARRTLQTSESRVAACHCAP
jgi:hypothetical protein